jgi:5-methylcytosine-specific restriction endonuclease McrA
MKRSPVRKVRRKPRPGRLKGEALDALKLECFVLDNWTCRECGRWVSKELDLFHPNRAHAAHIGAKRRYGDSLENFRTLCSGCHQIEHNYGKSRKKPCPPKERAA